MRTFARETHLSVAGKFAEKKYEVRLRHPGRGSTPTRTFSGRAQKQWLVDTPAAVPRAEALLAKGGGDAGPV